MGPNRGREQCAARMELGLGGQEITGRGTGRRPRRLATAVPERAGGARVRSAGVEGETVDEMLKRLRRDLPDDMLERACHVVLRRRSASEPRVVVAGFPGEVQIIIGEPPGEVRVIFENGPGTSGSRPSNRRSTRGRESLWQRSSRWVRNRWKNGRK